MQCNKQENQIVTASYLEVDAGVRYWDDATINGESDESGDSVPFKSGDRWVPVINIESGVVEDWPQGTTGNFHFKVCDDGDYYLLDEHKNRLFKHNNYYVPGGFLDWGDRGFGDYIIFDVNENGKIDKFNCPDFDSEIWDNY